MPQSHSTKRVLLVAPHPGVHGGVSAFAQMIGNYASGTEIIPFWIGSRQDRKESALATLGRLLVTPFTMRRIIRRQSIDVVHLNPSLTRKCLVREGLILLMLHMMGFPRVLVYCHGWQQEVADRLATNILQRIIFVRLLNGVAAIAVLAPEFKASLVAMGMNGDKIFITRTMFDGRFLKAEKENTGNPARRSILFMSRLERGKGVYELLAAFKNIADEFPDTDLILAGDGVEKHELQTRAQAYGLASRVMFPGYVGGAEKARLLMRCTLFALPSYYGEGMPIALLEAMAAGKPLIASAVGGIPHIIREPDNGIVLQTVDEKSIERALRRLLEDSAACDKIGKENARYAWKRFEASQVTAEIEAVYHTLASR